ncbi:hypothetical protein Tsubulata_007278 [Turnera subulata]|uniref:Elongation factor EFG domain-containing protein n=1 Tax=Turnera subulata TaxID=218843 RepID=A0A9Q0GG34_9ROSI|nr:hypothetical protein Tsubulata_007278 [Turnera subulata]
MGLKKSVLVYVKKRLFVLWLGKKLELINKNAILKKEEVVDGHPRRAMEYSVSQIVRVVHLEFCFKEEFTGGEEMIPASDKASFFAGKLSTGLKVRIMGPNYVPGEKKDLSGKNVQGITVIWLGKKQEMVGDVPCGNTVAMVGLDQFVSKKLRVKDLANGPEATTGLHGWQPSPESQTLHGGKANGGWTYVLRAPLMMRAALVRGMILRLAPRMSCRLCLWSLILLTKTGPDMVFDMCNGVHYLNEIKDSDGFQGASKAPALCCFEVFDVLLPADAIHGGQVIPTTARRIIFASQLTAKPRLLEAVYLVDIKAPENALGGIYGVLNQKRGHVFEEMQRPGTPLYNIKAYLPVIESFGFSSTLTGQALPQCVFDHWDLLNADAIHRGGGQVPRRVIYAASQLMIAKPRSLLEPVYLVEIQAPEKALATAALYNIISAYYFHVIESFGYSTTLREATSGQALDHWDLLNADPLQAAGPQAASLRGRA